MESQEKRFQEISQSQYLRKSFTSLMITNPMYNNQEIRKKVEETRRREEIRDALSLQKRSPQETLKMMFELCEFTQKVRRAADGNL
jgi:hypothetical protein